MKTSWTTALAAILAAILIPSISTRAFAQHAHCDSTTLSSAEIEKITALMQAGLDFEDNEQLDSAIATNKQILAICNNFAPALTTIAGLYGKQGKLNAEIEWANKAIAADTTYSNAYVNLSNAYALLGNTDLARVTLRKAIGIDPKSPVPYYSMGVISEGDDDLPGAVDWYNKSIAADSTFTSSYYNVAMIYARTGEKEKAVPYLKRETELDPDDEQAQHMLVRIFLDIVKEKAKEQQQQAPDNGDDDEYRNDQG